jgi:transcriptional regulator with XRE-family HTH domain
MILTGRNIKDMLKALYGERFIAPAARGLGCSEKTVWLWVHGETSPKVQNRAQIRRALDAKIEELQRWRDEFCST